MMVVESAGGGGVIVLGPKHLGNTLSNDIATLDGIALASSTTVRNLVISDEDLSFNYLWWPHHM